MKINHFTVLKSAAACARLKKSPVKKAFVSCSKGRSCSEGRFDIIKITAKACSPQETVSHENEQNKPNERNNPNASALPFSFLLSVLISFLTTVAFTVSLLILALLPSKVLAGNYGGGTTYTAPITDTTVYVSTGTNAFQSTITATGSGSDGGTITVYSGVNTFGGLITAAGNNTTTSATGGQMTIVAGTNTFNNGLVVNSGTGASSYGTLNVSSGTNTFGVVGASYDILVGGTAANIVNGTINISGGTNVFNVAVTAADSGSLSGSTAGGSITLSGGTNTFNAPVKAENGNITISGGTSGVTLLGFAMSQFQSTLVINGTLNLINMTVDSNLSSSGTINASTSSTASGSMTFADGVTLSSTTGNLNINGGTMVNSLTLSAPTGTVSLGGLTSDSTDTINVTAAQLLLSGSVQAQIDLTSTTAVTVNTGSASSATFGDIKTVDSSAPSLTVSGGNTFSGSLTGFSSLSVQSGANIFSQDLSLTNGATISSGTNTFSGTLTTGTTSSGTISVANGINTFVGAVTADTGNVTISGGTNTFDSSLAVSGGRLTVSGGSNSFSAASSGSLMSATSGIVISSGTNTFNGSVVESDLTFSGASSISGNLTMSAGSALVGPDLTISAPLTFVITPSMSASTPVIDGSAADSITTTGGQVTIDLSALPAGTTNSYTLIQGSASRSSDFSPLDGSVSTLMYQYSYEQTGNNFVLDVTRNKSAQSVANELGNNAQAAYALYPSMGTALFNVTDEQQAYNNIEAATGSNYANASTVQIQRLNYTNQMIVNQLLSSGSQSLFANGPYCPGGVPGSIAPFGPGGTNIWTSGFGIGGTGETRNGINGCDFTSYGFLLGMDVDADEGCRLGMFYGYSQNDIDSYASSIQSDDHTFGFYGKWQSIWLYGYSAFLFDFSFNKYEGNRAWNSANYNSGYDGRMASLYYEKGWDWFLFENWQLNPYLAFQYIYFTSDSFSDGALNVGTISFSDTRGIVGMRLKQDWKKCVWEEKIAYHQRFRNDNPDFVASYSGTDALVYGNAEGSAWAEFNFRIVYPLDKYVTLYGNYYLLTNSYSTLNAGMGTLEFKF